ncbi:MAG: SOS response-associated peptidase, partial [Janthinobacterium lividum]
DRELILARWGLVPFFTKDIQDIKGLSTINARSETITKAPTWREPFKKRRCLVPVSSFYEWPKEGKPPKQPYAFELSSGATFAFAGLWDAWKDREGHWLQSFAIVTTSANPLMSRVHPRMPVILHPRDYDRWLDREGDEDVRGESKGWKRPQQWTGDDASGAQSSRKWRTAFVIRRFPAMRHMRNPSAVSKGSRKIRPLQRNSQRIAVITTLWEKCSYEKWPL